MSVSGTREALVSALSAVPEGCLLCEDGILLHEDCGMHELPEPFGMMPCQKRNSLLPQNPETKATR